MSYVNAFTRLDTLPAVFAWPDITTDQGKTDAAMLEIAMPDLLAVHVHVRSTAVHLKLITASMGIVTHRWRPHEGWWTICGDVPDHQLTKAKDTVTTLLTLCPDLRQTLDMLCEHIATLFDG